MKLDERAAAESNSHARFKRKEGSVVEKIAPMNCKSWMLKKEGKGVNAIQLLNLLLQPK